MSEREVTRHTFPSPFAVGHSGGAPAWAVSTAARVRALAFGPRPSPEPAPAAVPDLDPCPQTSRGVASTVDVDEPTPAADSTAIVAPELGRTGASAVGAVTPPTTEGPHRALREAAAALERARGEVLSVVTDEILALAVDIASVLVEDELSHRPELHRTLVRAALDGLEPGPGLRVRATRATYESLLEAFGQASIDAGRGRVAVELDASLEGVGAIVDVRGASIDARVEPRLRALRVALEHAQRTRHAA